MGILLAGLLALVVVFAVVLVAAGVCVLIGRRRSR